MDKQNDKDTTNPKKTVNQMGGEICGQGETTPRSKVNVRSCYKLGDEGELVNIKISDSYFTLLVDTGSQVSLLSPSAFRRLPKGTSLEPIDLTLEAVNDTLFPVKGVFKAPLVIDDNIKSVRKEFIVADIEGFFDVDGILGMDIMRPLGAVVDVENCQIKLQGVWLPTFRGNSTAILAEEIKLPPQSVSFT